MILLDTDHISVLQVGIGARCERLVEKMQNCSEPVLATIISVEENMRGWMASIAKEKDPHRQT